MKKDNAEEGCCSNIATNRTGEKIGWIGGWSGGFLWVAVFAVVEFAQSNVAAGIVSLGLFVLAITLVIRVSPWRYPTTRYFTLMLPIYAVLLAAVGWVIWRMGGFGDNGMKPWYFLWVISCMSPLMTIGRRCWQDGDPPKN